VLGSRIRCWIFLQPTPGRAPRARTEGLGRDSGLSAESAREVGGIRIAEIEGDLGRGHVGVLKPIGRQSHTRFGQDLRVGQPFFREPALQAAGAQCQGLGDGVPLRTIASRSGGALHLQGPWATDTPHGRCQVPARTPARSVWKMLRKQPVRERHIALTGSAQNARFSEKLHVRNALPRSIGETDLPGPPVRSWDLPEIDDRND
jgi:hypothetical protein